MTTQKQKTQAVMADLIEDVRRNPDILFTNIPIGLNLGDLRKLLANHVDLDDKTPVFVRRYSAQDNIILNEHIVGGVLSNEQSPIIILEIN